MKQLPKAETFLLKKFPREEKYVREKSTYWPEISFI